MLQDRTDDPCDPTRTLACLAVTWTIAKHGMQTTRYRRCGSLWKWMSCVHTRYSFLWTYRVCYNEADGTSVSKGHRSKSQTVAGGPCAITKRDGPLPASRSPRITRPQTFQGLRGGRWHGGGRATPLGLEISRAYGKLGRGACPHAGEPAPPGVAVGRVLPPT